MARCLLYLFGGAATLGLVSVLFFELEAGADRGGLLATIAGGYLVAAIVLLLAERMPIWGFQAVMLAGTGLVSAGLYFSGDPRNDNEMFYALAVIYAFYFFTPVQASLQLGAVGAAYAGSLAATEGAGRSAPGRWLIAMGVLAVAGLTVKLLKQRVDGLVTQLADAARRDSLTGLLNRRGFDETFDKELERVRRSGGELGVLVVDLDRFKEINDVSGHAEGDRALQRFAALLTAGARQIDVAARIGGEEFALLVPATSAEASLKLAERLRLEVREAFGGDEAALTASFGVAEYPQDGETVEELLRAADQALYAAKARGRDRCVAFSVGAPSAPGRARG